MLVYTSCQHASCWVKAISPYGCWCFRLPSHPHQWHSHGISSKLVPVFTAASTMPVFPLPPRIHICTHDFMVFPWSPRIHSCHPWGHNVSLAYSSLAQGLLLHTAILFTYNPHLLYFEQFKTFFVQGLRFWMCSILPKTREVPRNWSEGRTKECHFCPLSLTAWVECSAHNGHLKDTSWVKKMEK